MSRLLFENSKFALGFAAVTLVGAGVLMGTDNSLSGVEVEAESEPTPSQQAVVNTRKATPPAPPKDQPIIADWASDEELIDTAEGFNPSPEQTAELVDGDSKGKVGGNTASSNPKPGGAPVGGSAPAGPAPSTPKSASRSKALDVK